MARCDGMLLHARFGNDGGMGQQARHVTSGIRSNPVTIRLRNLHQKNNVHNYRLLGSYAAQLWHRS